ncbi:unnamed protein product [Dibothriocephalus latus]|uniref:Zinc-ribbon domain-containing protein n=1 Tax=Dibothriocephalus latus TaxID=60516 RepID=A0A3P7M6W8_DIBLA|nr:unnamed protein product [Dibothriocephalus latus]
MFVHILKKPMLSASRCGSTSAASISFMSAVTSNSQYRSAKAADHFQQPTAASPANSLSLVYLDVEGAPSADASMRSDNMLKPSTYSSDACKPTSLPSYALGNVTSAILTQTLRSDQFRPSRDRPVIYNEQRHLTSMNEVPPQGGSPTKTATMVQNISISDSTESFAQQKFCSQCGERFFENAKFCGLCGTSRRFGCQPSLVATAVRPRVNLASGQAASSQ